MAQPSPLETTCATAEKAIREMVAAIKTLPADATADHITELGEQFEAMCAFFDAFYDRAIHEIRCAGPEIDQNAESPLTTSMHDQCVKWSIDKYAAELRESAGRPDPDYRYDLMRDERMGG